ncbi:hypothetical protein [Curtobacterium sp. ISL-83]|uniref:hypothetical protein n=1 Tax=Curtobacterium sp. ISL-83 TaxID=2819145 RepID=UPI001BE75E41|nr:hypothetical protein [Curtobacterium sp. ISL-83]MBT2502335.1 hypothetical protein [Curtobacterium sp. ISL-83]
MSTTAPRLRPGLTASSAATRRSNRAGLSPPAADTAEITAAAQHAATSEAPTINGRERATRLRGAILTGLLMPIATFLTRGS